MQKTAKVLKFGFKVFIETFYCHVRVKDLHLFILFEKNHHNFNMNLNIRDLNFIFKKV